MSEQDNQKLHLSARDIKRVRTQIVGESKIDYYTKIFDRFDMYPDKKISFNIFALLASYFWAFYRGLYLHGAVGMVAVLGGFYMVLFQNPSTVTPWVVIGNILMLLPSFFFGLFGNYTYYKSITPLIQEGLLLPKSKQEKFFKEYAGGNGRIVLGLVFASVFILFALTFSALG